MPNQLGVAPSSIRISPTEFTIAPGKSAAQTRPSGSDHKHHGRTCAVTLAPPSVRLAPASVALAPRASPSHRRASASHLRVSPSHRERHASHLRASPSHRRASALAPASIAFPYCTTGTWPSRIWPPPKLIRCGTSPPGVILTAQYLNSGILPNGSSTGLVSRFAAAS